jgi:hypothetical protein
VHLFVELLCLLTQVVELLRWICGSRRGNYA